MGVLKVYTTTGYGSILNDEANWDTCHDATSGDSVDTGTFPYTESSVAVGGATRLIRTFFPFDTSSLPDSCTIKSATFYLYVYSVTNTDNDGNDWMNLVQTTQADSTSLATADFDQCGDIDNPTEGSTRWDIGNFVSEGWQSWVLNATGLTWISKTSYTNLGMRVGNDCVDHAVGAGLSNSIRYVSTNQTGTAYDPYLSISYVNKQPKLTMVGTGG